MQGFEYLRQHWRCGLPAESGAVGYYRERLYKLHLRMQAEEGLTTVRVHRISAVRKL